MNIPPRPGPEWRFRTPPGWPTPPAGWAPTAAWAGPEEHWPEPPPYWVWWTRDPEPASPQEPPRSLPRRLRVPLIAIGAAVVALIAALVIINLNGDRGTPSAGSANPEPAPTHTPAPSPSPAAHDQAVAINALLESSKPSRGALRKALGQLRNCTKAGAAIASIEKVTQQRGSQAERAKGLQVDALPDGESLKTALVQALSASHRADAAYLKWAKRFRSNDCSGQTVGDPDYDTGNSASEEATEAKTTFVGLWNAVAEQEGLPSRTEAEI